jgi:hypothetical protein
LGIGDWGLRIVEAVSLELFWGELKGEVWGMRIAVFFGGGILGDVLVLAGDGFGLGVLRDAGVGCGGGV